MNSSNFCKNAKNAVFICDKCLPLALYDTE